MSSQGSHEEARGRYLAALSLTALGIVFGDIGTSPIYALRESFHAANGIDPTQANVLDVLSLILWSLIIVISIKYLTFVMRADNHGEGGIIALTALVAPPSPHHAIFGTTPGHGGHRFAFRPHHTRLVSRAGPAGCLRNRQAGLLKDCSRRWSCWCP